MLPEPSSLELLRCRSSADPLLLGFRLAARPESVVEGREEAAVVAPELKCEGVGRRPSLVVGLVPSASLDIDDLALEAAVPAMACVDRQRGCTVLVACPTLREDASDVDRLGVVGREPEVFFALTRTVTGLPRDRGMSIAPEPLSAFASDDCLLLMPYAAASGPTATLRREDCV